MSEALISKRLLNDVRDLLHDQAKVKVRSDGLIYRRFTEAQMYFMESLRTTKVPWPLILYEGVTDYPLPRNIIEIVDVHFSKDDLNPMFEIPRGALSTVRSIKVTNPQVWTPLGYTTTTDTDNMIATGDIITLDVFWRPDDDAKIDFENDPEIEPGYQRYLTDYALSFYRDYKYEVGGELIREQNPQFMTKEEVYSEVRNKRNIAYGLNKIQSINASFVRF